jgi:hypothetical protein
MQVEKADRVGDGVIGAELGEYPLSLSAAKREK